MAMPDFQTIMLPLLTLLADQQSRNMSELIDQIAGRFQLTELEQSEMLPSGQRRLSNRTWWARTDLLKAGLLESPSRGTVRISERGLQVLSEHPARVDRKFLKRYPEYVEFLHSPPLTSPSKPGAQLAADETTETPEEAIDRAHRQFEATLAEDILGRIRALSPPFFEKLVVDVLVAMGYGGSIGGAAQVVGKSGDKGIDGEISEDKLGLDKIYLQAKRWDSSVGREVVQAFAGSLAGHQATKGVFITTGTFTANARAYVEHLPMRIVLIDGPHTFEADDRAQCRRVYCLH